MRCHAMWKGLVLVICLILLALRDRIGRKAMASTALLLSRTFTAASGIIIVNQTETESPDLLVSLSVIGRFGVTVADNLAARYATELIPTCVRNRHSSCMRIRILWRIRSDRVNDCFTFGYSNHYRKYSRTEC